MDTLFGPAKAFKEGDRVKIKGGCPHIWVVYAWIATAYHIERWDESTATLVRWTVSPDLLIKV